MRRVGYAFGVLVLAAVMVGSVSAMGAVPNTWENLAENPVVEIPGDDAYYPDVVYSASRFDGHGADHPYKMYYDDGLNTWLAYSENGEAWETVGAAPVISGLRHPQVAYDADAFGDDAGDLIQASFPETYTVTPYYKLWLWDYSGSSAIRFAYSDDGVDWHTEYPRDVCPRDEPGWLNPGSPIYDLEVLFDGTSYRGWADNNGRMYNVSSSDGTTWTLDAVTPVAIELGASGEWDSASLSRMSVVKISDTEYHAWYGGSTGGGGNKGVGHASSADGIVWTKDVANPLTSLGGYGPFSGLGEPGSWNNNRNYAISVLYDADRFDVRRGDAAMFKMLRSGDSTVTGEKSIGFAQDDIDKRAHELWGAKRYETSVEVSKDVYFRGADTVVIATGLNWPDALGGTALAGAYDGPILLVRTDEIPAAVEAEITRLGATKAFVLGGETAVAQKVVTALDVMGLTVTRLGGRTRYETANLVAEETISKLEAGPGFEGTAFAATGALFPDAVSASPVAASQGWPIYLVRPTLGAPITEMENQNVTDVLIVGGPKSVSEFHEQALEDAFGDENVDRLSGSDRYATSVAVATYGVDNAGLEWNWFAIATGQAFPDALTGAMAPASEGSVIMLTRTTSLPAVVDAKIAEERASIRHVFIIGGDAAVSPAVRESVKDALQ